MPLKRCITICYKTTFSYIPSYLPSLYRCLNFLPETLTEILRLLHGYFIELYLRRCFPQRGRSGEFMAGEYAGYRVDNHRPAVCELGIQKGLLFLMQELNKQRHIIGSRRRMYRLVRIPYQQIGQHKPRAFIGKLFKRGADAIVTRNVDKTLRNSTRHASTKPSSPHT